MKTTKKRKLPVIGAFAFLLAFLGSILNVGVKRKKEGHGEKSEV